MGTIVAADAQAAAGAPRTLLVSPTRINAFAQDGLFIAWKANAPNETRSRQCGQAHIRSLVTGRQRSWGTAIEPVCGGRIELVRNTAFWSTDAFLCGNCQYSAKVVMGALDDPKVVTLAKVVAWWTSGIHLTGLGADGGFFAYSRARYNQVDTVPHCFEEPVPCVFETLGGSVTRVVDGERHLVPGAGAPAFLAVGGGRIAVAPSDELWEGGPDMRPAEDGPVNVLNPTTGSSVATVFPTGMVAGLAISRDALAVIAKHTDGSVVIERYALPAGTLVASTAVPSTILLEGRWGTIEIGRKWIVYVVNRTIRLIGPLGHSRPLFRATDTPTPTWISIDGRRVAWVENGHARHRIRTALAPE